MEKNMSNVTDWRNTLAVYRKANEVEIFVPAMDGQTAIPLRLRKIGVEDLMFSGRIPDSLSGLVDGMLTGKQSAISISAGDMVKMGALFDTVLLACVQFPPLAETGDDEHLGLDEIPFAVKEAIFGWVNGDALALEKFRQRPGADGESGHSGAAVRDAAEQPGGAVQQLGSVPV
jgi:hypothetical protein